MGIARLFKEELWGAAYEKAVEVWKGIAFKGVRKITDPIDRIEKVVETDLFRYCGDEEFAGGCFFFNMRFRDLRLTPNDRAWDGPNGSWPLPPLPGATDVGRENAHEDTTCRFK